MKNKIKLIIIIILFIFTVIIRAHIYKDNIHIGVLFSDATQKDSEIKFLDEKLNIKKSIKFKGINSPMVSCINNNIYIFQLDSMISYFI